MKSINEILLCVLFSLCRLMLSTTTTKIDWNDVITKYIWYSSGWVTLHYNYTAARSFCNLFPIWLFIYCLSTLKFSRSRSKKKMISWFLFTSNHRNINKQELLAIYHLIEHTDLLLKTFFINLITNFFFFYFKNSRKLDFDIFHSIKK